MTVVSILALAVAVAAIGIGLFGAVLQWLAYRATTDQLTAIGRENARLGERIAQSLGALHESATTTRSRLDTTLDQLVSGLLGRVAPSTEGAGAEVSRLQPAPAGEAAGAGAQETERERERWRVEQAVRAFGSLRAAPRVLQYLAGGARDSNDLGTQLVELRPEGEDQDPWMWDIAAIIGVFKALDLLAVDREKGVVTLTAPGRQIAARLAEAKHD